MNCPKCKENKDFTLYESTDDYQDGVVVCLNCGAEIATFLYTITIKEEIKNGQDN